MAYTMEDFRRDYTLEHFRELPPEYQRKILQKLSPEALRKLHDEMARQVIEPRLREFRAACARKRRPHRKC